MELKRIIIMVIMLVMLTITVFAASFNTKEDAIDWIIQKRAERVIMYQEAKDTIHLTSNKKCSINIDSSVPICKVCYSFNITVNDENKPINDCVKVPHDATQLNQIAPLIKERAKAKINSQFENVEAVYEEGDIIGSNIPMDE